MASRFGPAQPRDTGWNGAGGWLIFSQSRQVNFSRTALRKEGLDHLPLPGHHLQRLGHVLAHLHDLGRATSQVQAAGASITTRSRGPLSRFEGKPLPGSGWAGNGFFTG